MLKVSTASSKLQHKPSLAQFDKFFTVLSIGPYGRLPQIARSALLTLAIVFGFVLSLQ